MANRTLREAQGQGLDEHEQEAVLQETLQQYEKTEVLRMAVKDVRKRGKELEKKRKM